MPFDPTNFDRHPDGVMRLRAVRDEAGVPSDFEWSYLNAAASRALSRSDLIGKTLGREIPTSLENGLYAALEATNRSGEPCSFDHPSFTLTGLKDGDGVFVFLQRKKKTRADDLVHADLADRKRLEQEREELLARLDALITHAPVGIVAFDRELRIVSLNEEAALDGRSIDSHLGRTLGELRPAWAERVEPLLRRVRDAGEAIRGVEFRGPGSAPNEERHWVMNYYAIRDRRGEVRGIGVVSLDITAQKRVENQLRESEERFQQFMRNCPASAYIKDADLRYVWVNAYLERRLERPLEQWIGGTDADIFPPEEAARVGENDRAVLTSGAVTSLVETVTVAGRPAHYLSYKFPMHDSHGRAMLAGMSVNITDQVEAQERVRRLNAELEAKAGELQTVLDLVPIAIFMAHDPNCQRVTGNRAAAELIDARGRANLSLTVASEERHTPQKLLHEGRELGPMEMPMRRAARGHPVRGEEYDIVFEDGRRKHFFGYASPLYDAEHHIRGSIAAFLDITDRKFTEANLERRTRRLQLLWEAARILMTVHDLDAMVRALFEKIRADLGLDLYENCVVEPQAPRLRLVSSAGIPPEAAAALASIDFGGLICGEVAERSEPIVLTDVQDSTDARAASLRELGVQAYVCNPLMAGGRLVGTLSFGSCSKRAFTQDEVEFLETITQYVAVAGERLLLIEQLREADRRKDTFIATLAHELRNPLAPIRNAVQLLKAKGPPEPKLVWCRNVIDRQVHYMTRLLEDLLDVSRISRGKLEVRRERVALSAVIDVAVETSRPMVEAGRHQLTVSLPASSICVDGDPVRLAQVFSNLLNNAAKYTPEGGEISLSVERRETIVVVSVRDNGIGITSDMLPKVFDIFAQAAPALERAQGGLGIGLSLVKGLVELHGGKVSVRSEGSNCGSEFSVELPIVGLPQASDSDEHAASVLVVKHRVLVVDDNVDNADSLAALLEITGSEVMTAYDGEQALRIAESFKPTVMLLDIGMPRMNGYQVCRRLREQAWGRAVFLIAMTGWGQTEDRRQTQEAGFDHHLVKPVDSTALMKLLAERSP
ncbi:hybrid sensor histidine kinase/response regulator [Polyangium jinanense]|uniref:histidine kinase n=1 Tax=Polyangium jinanense TaxID=2829994 RepID=A0A9X3XFC4_9BACT|nr:PAS domain-containing protein [Polyangium jinanense]MDC3957070.1 PAS domain-containing protein [Polyangium jinanense]MDC3987056.1 PAS domain-containing protein [Polyangium jinanense]